MKPFEGMILHNPRPFCQQRQGRQEQDTGAQMIHSRDLDFSFMINNSSRVWKFKIMQIRGSKGWELWTVVKDAQFDLSRPLSKAQITKKAGCEEAAQSGDGRWVLSFNKVEAVVRVNWVVWFLLVFQHGYQVRREEMACKMAHGGRKAWMGRVSVPLTCTHLNGEWEKQGHIWIGLASCNSCVHTVLKIRV